MPISPIAWAFIAYGLASAATFAAYGIDKRRAGRGAWRVRERTLHLMELAGGWPGALLAQGFFRHKRRKTRFVLVVWAIALLHAAGWAAWYLYLA